MHIRTIVSRHMLDALGARDYPNILTFKIKRFLAPGVGNRRDSDTKWANGGGNFDRRNGQMSESPGSACVGGGAGDSYWLVHKVQVVIQTIIMYSSFSSKNIVGKLFFSMKSLMHTCVLFPHPWISKWIVFLIWIFHEWNDLCQKLWTWSPDNFTPQTGSCFYTVLLILFHTLQDYWHIHISTRWIHTHVPSGGQK